MASCGLIRAQTGRSQLTVALWRSRSFTSLRNFCYSRSTSSPLLPPNPTTLPKPPGAGRTRPRRSRLVRASLAAAIVLGAGYAVDEYANASGIARAFRTFRTGIHIAIDYKINFQEHPPFADSIQELHRRSAERVTNLLVKNGGLYLKMGQAMALQASILPAEFQLMFSRMYDAGSQNGWDDVRAVIEEDFGKSPEELFSLTGDESGGLFERKARASASVAQVHWAKLPDGREVAVKVQKREIKAQIRWDLWALRVVMRAYSWWFDMPLYTLFDFISERLVEETDFSLEARNTIDLRALVEADKGLVGRVYVPKVYPELSSKRILTAEWIEGVPLWNVKEITNPWYGGYRRGSPGAEAPLDDPDSIIQDSPLTPKQIEEGVLKPTRDRWKGHSKEGGLGASPSTVMTALLDVFSAQLFRWGIVHCDPHPGNIFVRRLPSGQPQVVILDHGLYVRMTEEFREQYSRFWKSIIQFDFEEMKQIGKEWGIESAELFASFATQRPYESPNSPTAVGDLVRAGKTDPEVMNEVDKRMKEASRKILANEASWPRELMFLARSVRILQANNQLFGSPVNRIKIMGLWASRSLYQNESLPLSRRVRNMGRHIVFRFLLFLSDLAWWTARVRQLIGWGKGMDDDLELLMKRQMKSVGLEVDRGLYSG